MNAAQPTAQRVVIVGGGKAGIGVAAGLRALAYSGSITVLEAQTSLPYDRPPLSKEFLQTGGDTAQFAFHSDAFYHDQQIDLRLGVAVAAIHRSQRHVVMADGTRVAYDTLVLATGALARKLDVPGSDLLGVHYLRSDTDAQTLRATLLACKNLVVVGAGFIGLEVAASAVALGCRVSVVEAGAVALSRAVPAALAERVLAEHRRRGVTVHLSSQVQAFTGEDGLSGVALADGRVLPCEAALVGIGAVPATTLAADAGMSVQDGVVVDAQCRSIDPHIYALGDACRFPAPHGCGLVRLEAWRNAEAQANHVAHSILGSNAPYDDLPFFWSEQFGLTLQVLGHPAAGVQTVERDLGNGARIWFHLDANGRLAGSSAWGSLAHIGREMRASEHLIRRGVLLSAADLSNPAVPLKTLLRR